jgi:hypothetical protein
MISPGQPPYGTKL